MALACGGDPASPPEASYTIAIRAGSVQEGPAGSILAQPLQVTVADVASQPVQGVVVRFRPVSGGGSLTDTIGVTGMGGIALSFARLGPTVGPQRFEAYMARAPKTKVVFEITATAGAALTRIEPAPVEAGDTVSIIGSNFNVADPSGNRVFFGSMQARILAAEGNGELRVVVPACAGAGSIPVRVEVGSAVTNTISVSYTGLNPLLGLQVGEGITVSGAELRQCLRLPSAGPRYLIIPQFAAAASSLSPVSFRIGYEDAAPVAQIAPTAAMPRLTGLSPQQRLDAQLRRSEQDIAPLAAMQEMPEGMGALEALTLNSTRSFQIISEIPPNNGPFKFVKTVARLKYIGDHILVYVDEGAPSVVADADLTRIGQLFDTRLYDLTVARFGSESDLDRNGKVIVLMSQHVNRLTPRSDCSTGFVAGYFYSNDLYLRNQYSNKGEIFYTIVPDPGGTISCTHTISSVRRRVPPTFVHEFQHMISFNQHVLARGGSTEDIWLNEGLSAIAEEMTARVYEELYAPVPGQMFSDSASLFVEDLLVNAYTYLFATKSYSVATSDDYPGLQDRGAAWLFLRWLGDQKGNEIYGRLVQTRLTSIENIQDKSGESFRALFGDFAIATAADIPGFARGTLVPRYRFTPRPRALHYTEIFQRLAFPGKTLPNPVQFSLLQRHATAESQSMLGGTMAYFNLQTAALPQPTIGLVFSAGDGSAFPATLAAQVGIVRVQ
jgi:hypothetical protein